MTEAIKELKKLLGKNKTVYTTSRHVSASGMQRVISCFVIARNKRADGTTHEIQCIDQYVKKICGYKYHNKYDGLVINGCGMDMGFAIVYDLSRSLYANKDRAGYELKQRWL